MEKVWLSLILIILWMFTGYSQQIDSEIISVNKKIEKCLKDNDSAAGWGYCYQLEKNIWQKKMEEYYQKLLKNLPSKYKQMLIDDQNNWLKWQKQHYKFLNTFMARKMMTV